MAKQEIPEEIAALSFEQAVSELERIVQQLEAGEIGLEDSIDIYSRGEILKRHCEEKLRTAEEKVAKVLVNSDGHATGIEAMESS